MNIVYKVTFIPHLTTTYPKYYIGSKFKYSPGYYGSVSSNKKFDFTNGITLKKWWKLQIKNNPENFFIEILEECPNMTKYELVECELKWQCFYNIHSKEFFNQAYASGKFVSHEKDQVVRKKISESLKKFYNTEEGKSKKDRLIAKNKKQHSEIMKTRWSNPTEKMINRIITGRPKGSSDVSKRQVTFRRLTDGIQIFNNANDAALVYNITPTNIRRRCRLNYKGIWRYMDD